MRKGSSFGMHLDPPHRDCVVPGILYFSLLLFLPFSFVFVFIFHPPFSSFQFKMVYMRVEKHIHAPPCLSEVSAALPLKQSSIHLIDDSPLSSFHGRLSSLSTPLLRVIDGVISLAVCPLVVSQAPQHFRSSEMQASCDGCFSHQSICWVIYLIEF